MFFSLTNLCRQAFQNYRTLFKSNGKHRLFTIIQFFSTEMDDSCIFDILGAVYRSTQTYDASFYLGGGMYLAGALCHMVLHLPCVERVHINKEKEIDTPSPHAWCTCLHLWSITGIGWLNLHHAFNSLVKMWNESFFFWLVNFFHEAKNNSDIHILCNVIVYNQNSIHYQENLWIRWLGCEWRSCYMSTNYI